MKKIVLILVTLFLLSCNNTEDCGACFTPPQSFLFEIVDKASGENLFTNGTYNSQEIEIINSLNDNSPIEFEFISEDNINLIRTNSIGWSTEIFNLKFYISNQYLFDFYVDAERKSEDCCNFTQYNEITITEAEFELDSQSGIYKILVE
tara:strand:- start:20 stop:466 length:447 start_codon:yes stop_codon:yes gene_type:complete